MNTTTDIKTKVDRGLAIRAQMEALKAELEDIETTLESAALAGEQIPLEERDREGRQFIAHGTEMLVPVVLESDMIMGSFQEGGQAHSNILFALELHGDVFPQLWKPVSKFEMFAKDGQNYRKKLRELLPPTTAANVLAASLARDGKGIPKSRVIVDWKRAKLIA